MPDVGESGNNSRLLDVQENIDEWLSVVLVGDRHEGVRLDAWKRLAITANELRRKMTYLDRRVSCRDSLSHRDHKECLLQCLPQAPCLHSQTEASRNPQPDL